LSVNNYDEGHLILITGKSKSPGTKDRGSELSKDIQDGPCRGNYLR
jgi:hypothetical protein